MALNMNDGTKPPTEFEQLQTAVREAAEKIARYEAGQELLSETDVWGKELTPGQLWHKLLNATEDQRQALLMAFVLNARTASACFAQDHQGLGNQLEEERELLSIAVFGVSTNDSARQLHTAVRALRSVMVDGIAARTTEVEYAEAEPETFPEEPDVREKIGAQLKTAGIDLSSVCGYEWGTEEPCVDNDSDGRHLCGEINPLHVQSHNCGGRCRTELTQVEAEQLAEAGQ